MRTTAAPPRRRVLVLLNPGAGQGPRLEQVRRSIQAAGGPQLELMVPDPSDQNSQLAQARAALDTGVDAVVVCGGDGMVSLAANLVADRAVPLGIVPTGSGNDFARTVGVPLRAAEAVHRVLHALAQPEIPVRAVDALRLHTSWDSDPRWAANSVNIGFDARVNQRANAQRRVPRQLRYLVALAQEVPRFRCVEFRMQIGSAAASVHESSLICIQNGSFIGGGIPLALGGRPDDGWAEVSHIAPLSRPGLVALFPLLMARMHRVLTPLVTQKVRQIRVEVPCGVPIFADGEELHSGRSDSGEAVDVSVEVVAGALHLLR